MRLVKFLKGELWETVDRCLANDGIAFIHTIGRNDLITSIEAEFPCTYEERDCHLWFFDNGLPGYSWYVPKADGYINIGIGGKLEALRLKDDGIKRQWELFIEQLMDNSLMHEWPSSPKGHNYYLRQNTSDLKIDNCYLVGDAAGLATKDMGEGIGPAIRSGILAAKSIIHGTDYLPKSIGKYSLPGMILPGFRSALRS